MTVSLLRAMALVATFGGATTAVAQGAQSARQAPPAPPVSAAKAPRPTPAPRAVGAPPSTVLPRPAAALRVPTPAPALRAVGVPLVPPDSVRPRREQPGAAVTATAESAPATAPLVRSAPPRPAASSNEPIAAPVVKPLLTAPPPPPPRPSRTPGVTI